MSGHRRGRPEQILQTKIVARLRRDFDLLVAHVPNGGSRGRLEGVNLKKAGVVAGHPDLVAYGRDGLVMLLEVKAPDEDLSKSQLVVIPELQARGFPVFVVDTVEEAVQAAVDSGFGPKRPPALRTLGGF